MESQLQISQCRSANTKSSRTPKAQEFRPSEKDGEIKSISAIGDKEIVSSSPGREYVVVVEKE